MESYVGSVLLLFFLILGVSAQVEVQFLKKITRFNVNTFRDFYFCCNVDGPNLQWEVNSRGIGGFELGDITYTLVGFPPVYPIKFTATLLSLRSTSTGYKFDSVLIVSIPDDSTINVRCLSDTGVGAISNRNDSMDTTQFIERNNGVVFLTHILRRRIVSDEQANTSIFMCGTEQQNQIWQIGTGNPQFGFDGESRISRQHFILTSDGATLKLQVIFMAKEPLRLVSLLFLTEPSDMMVRCSAGSQAVELSTALSTEGDLSTALLTEGDPGPESTRAGGTNKAVPVQVNAMKIALATVFSAMWRFLL